MISVFINRMQVDCALSGCTEKDPAKDSMQSNSTKDNAAFNSADNLTVHYLDVGQEDFELIQSGGKNIGLKVRIYA